MSISRRALVFLVAALACGLPRVEAQDATVFTASLDGAQNLPEPNKTPATGKAELRLSPDRKQIDYKVMVDQLLNPIAVYVHLGSTTQNGPPVVKLWPHGNDRGKTGTVSGVITEGSFTAADLTGPMAGDALSDLVGELKAGNVYINVRTSDGLENSSAGPGNFKLGEIRGQLK
jgi:hypothetical protein